MTSPALEPDAPLGAERLLSLLGQRADATDVRRLLERLELQPDLTKRWSVAVTAPEHGLGLRFKSGRELTDDEVHHRYDGMVLACVFFHAPGHEGHLGYAGRLPFGLEFAHARAQVRRALGAPFWSGAQHPSDRWNSPGRYLCLDFAEDEASIRLVTVGLPWRTPA